MHSIEFYEIRRKDNFLLLRILAACMVIYGHSFALTKDVGLTDIFLKYDWGRYSGDLAVSMFFVISGFMVSGSFLKRSNLVEYAQARFLRILPALIALLLVSAFLIGPLVTHLNVFNYFSNADTYKYIFKNLSFSSDLWWTLPGVFDSHKMTAINGSLWTLPAEMRMYAFVALLGVLGLLSNRTIGTIVIFGLFLAAILNPQLLPLHTDWVPVSGYFCIGILAQLYKEKVEVKHEVLIMLVFLTYISRRTDNYFFLLAITTAYFCFWFAYRTKHIELEKYGDPSYGIYLWGWPIQQLTIVVWPEITPWKNCIVSLFFAIAMGYLSWHLIERPALSLKNKIKFRTPDASLPGFSISKRWSMPPKPNFFKNTVALSSMHPRALLFVVFFLAVISVIWRFGSWMPDVFFGDDLYNLLAYKDGYFPGSLSDAVSVAFAEKYRPVFVWLMSLMYGAFDNHLLPYLAINVLLHALNATIVFAIARRLSHGNLMVALAVALAAATSRFALYQVTEVTGFLEGIALTLFLLMTYCMARANNENKETAWRWSWRALAAAFLVINTHERYIVVAVWLGLAFIVLPTIRALPRDRLFKLLGACIAIVLFNVLFKVIVLEMHFFVGTGATHMDLDALRVLEFIRQAVLSIFSFNEGPEYLVGARAISLGWFPVWLLAVVFTLAWLTAIVTGVRSALIEKVTTPGSRWQPVYWPLLLLILGGLMLGPPALTIRMEQRWELVPFILTLFMFAWAVGVQRQRVIVPVWILAVAIGMGTVVSDTFIAAHFDQIFFVSGERFAAVTKRDIVDKDPGQSAPVAFLADSGHCNWSLQNGEFFRLYAGTRRTVSCFGSVDEVNAAGLPASTRIYSLGSSPLSLLDVTSELSTLAHRDEKVTR